MTDKITVELPLEKAKELANIGWPEGGVVEPIAEAIKKALPPEWEEGALAWVTPQWDVRFRMLGEWSEGRWHFGRGRHANTWGPEDVTKVEPIRVLRDDEVAVSAGDVTKNFLGGIEEMRRYASTLDSVGRPAASHLTRLLADALEAERK